MLGSNVGDDALPKTNSSPLKLSHPKLKLVFQPSIFRCELLVSGMDMFLNINKLTWHVFSHVLMCVLNNRAMEGL